MFKQSLSIIILENTTNWTNIQRNSTIQQSRDTKQAKEYKTEKLFDNIIDKRQAKDRKHELGQAKYFIRLLRSNKEQYRVADAQKVIGAV